MMNKMMMNGANKCVQNGVNDYELPARMIELMDHRSTQA